MLEVVEAGVKPGEPENFAVEKMHVRWQRLIQFALRLLLPDLQLALAHGRRGVEARLQNQPDVIEHDPWRLDPRWRIGVELDFAMTVVAQEFFEPRLKFRPR